jgi:hypothetical protein
MNRTSKFAPGPWRWYEVFPGSTTSLLDADGNEVLQIYESQGGGAMPDGPNGRLIEAAPLLRAAITSVMTDAQLDTKPLALAGKSIRDVLAIIEGAQR